MSETEVSTDIFQSAFLVYVAIHRPRLQFQQKDLEVLLEGVSLDADISTKPQLKLLPDVWKDKYNAVESKIRAAIARHSYDAKSASASDMTELLGSELEGQNLQTTFRRAATMRGLHLVPIVKIEALVHSLEKCNEELRGISQDIADSFDDFKQAIHDHVKDPTVWGRVERLIPSIGDIISKTYIEWTMFPIGDPKQIEAVNKLSIAPLIKDRMESLVRGMADTLLRGPREELLKQLEKLHERVTDGKPLTARNVKGVLAVIDDMRSIATFSPEIMSALGELQIKIEPATMDTISSDALVSSGIAKYIANAMDVVGCEDIISSESDTLMGQRRVVVKG
jgi:hypothetical protein